MLWRSPLRTGLTFLSVVVAFFLFALLQSITQAFELGVHLAADDRLVVTYRRGLSQLLPISYQNRIASTDGVLAVGPVMFLGGYYQDPKNQIQAVAVDPTQVTVLDPRIVIPPEQAQGFASRRTGAVAGRDLAERFGWKIGDRIPIKSDMPRKDGAEVWYFDLVGLYELDSERTRRPVPATLLLFDYAHFNEVATYSDRVIWYDVRVRDAQQAMGVAKAIDAEFRNAEFETRTQTEAEFQRGFIRQFANVGKIMTAILSAVFFALVVVASNAMMQAYRERVPEMAVLKTLGFGDVKVAFLFAIEALLLCGLAGATGLALAVVAVTPLQQMTEALSALYVEDVTLTSGFGLALALGIFVSLVPAGLSARLSIVQGLAQHD